MTAIEEIHITTPHFIDKIFFNAVERKYIAPVLSTYEELVAIFK